MNNLFEDNLLFWSFLLTFAARQYEWSMKIYKGEFDKKLELQIAPSIMAGFPSPAEEYFSETLDFNRDMIHHPESTFYGRVKGDSLIDVGIEEGDIAVIDKSVIADHKSKNPTTRWSDIIELK